MLLAGAAGEQADGAPLAAPQTGGAPAVAAAGRWRQLLALWAVAFWINCKPSEPYLAKYLLEVKDLTESQLESEVPLLSLLRAPNIHSCTNIHPRMTQAAGASACMASTS